MGSNGEEPSHTFRRVSDEDDNLVLDDLELVDVDEITEIVDDEDNSNEEMVQGGDDSEVDSDNDETIIPNADNSNYTFNLRRGPVYACAFHPNGEVVVGGCEEETLYIWNGIDTHILVEEKFQDSVTLIKFNHDGKYLVAVDMAGNCTCWKYSDNNFTKMHSMNFNEPSAGVTQTCSIRKGQLKFQPVK